MSYLPPVGSLGALRDGRRGFIGELAGGAAGSVGTAQLADGAVTTAKLADNSVTSAKIVDGTIVAADLAATGVVAATYGGSLNSWDNAITVNAQGQVTAVAVYDRSIHVQKLIGPPASTVNGAAMAWSGHQTFASPFLSDDLTVITVNLTTATAAHIIDVEATILINPNGDTVTLDLQEQTNGGAFSTIQQCKTAVTPANSTHTFRWRSRRVNGSTYGYRILAASAGAANILTVPGTGDELSVSIIA